MIHGWPLLDGWIEQAREDLRTRQRILRAAEEWDGQDREPRPPLPRVAARSGLGLGGRPSGRARAARDGLHRRVGRSPARRDRSGRDGSDAAAGGSAGPRCPLSPCSRSRRWWPAPPRSSRCSAHRPTSEEARDRAARLLGTQASAESRADPLLGLALAAESIARSDRPPVDARRGLVAEPHTARRDGRPGASSARPSRSATPARSPSPPRRPGGDRFAHRRRSTCGMRRPASHGACSPHPSGGIQDLAIDPQGRWLVAGDADGRVWRWDLRSPGDAPTEPFLDLGEEQRNNVIWSVAFSPDGELIALGTEFSGVVLVDAATGEERTVPGTKGGADFLSVAFSPDGDRLVAGMGTGEVSGAVGRRRVSELGSVRAHPDDDVWEVAFDHTGRTLVTGSSDGTARAWDASTLEPIGDPLWARDTGNKAGLDGLVLSADGQTLYAGAGDGTVRTFDLSSSEETEVTGVGHSEEVIAAAASSDGKLLFTLGDDEQVRRWSLRAHRPVGTVLGSLPGTAAGIAVDPIGTTHRGERRGGQRPHVRPRRWRRSQPGPCAGRPRGELVRARLRPRRRTGDGRRGRCAAPLGSRFGPRGWPSGPAPTGPRSWAWRRVPTAPPSPRSPSTVRPASGTPSASPPAPRSCRRGRREEATSPSPLTASASSWPRAAPSASGRSTARRSIPSRRRAT